MSGVVVKKVARATRHHQHSETDMAYRRRSLDPMRFRNIFSLGDQSGSSTLDRSESRCRRSNSPAGFLPGIPGIKGAGSGVIAWRHRRNRTPFTP